MTLASIAFNAALPRASSANTSSISIRTIWIPDMRVASANPAAPTPAPKSTTRAPARAEVAAASNMASWPARWPDFGWRNRRRPPRNASSENRSWVSPPECLVIGPQFMGKPGVGEQLARLAVILLMDQNPARQHAERAFDDTHVLVQH